MHPTPPAMPAEPLWPQALTRYPFAAALLSGWRERVAELPEAYSAALDAALAAFDLERPLAERYQHLCASRARLTELAAAGDAHIATQLLRLRVWSAFGEPQAARQRSTELLEQREHAAQPTPAPGDGQRPPQTDHSHAQAAALRERPFLPSCALFDDCPPEGHEGDASDPNRDERAPDLNAWLSAMLLETHSHLSAERRHAQPQAELARLAQRRKLPCASIETERMLALAALRLGKKVTIKPGSRLLAEGLNAERWATLGEASDTAQPTPPPSEPSAAKPPTTRDQTTSASKPKPAAPARKQAATAKSRKANFWELDDPIRVVDIGANPIDGTPPYAGLLKQGVIELIGFEPQRDALAKLQQMKGPHETYLPHAIGDGHPATLYICQASGMTSTLKPNNAVLDHFHGYPIWGKVKQTEVIETKRLDDVPEIGQIDWLKIDIQGGELTVFKNAERALKDALVIQTEANFIQLYENQPLFADIDQWMRAHGFMLHTLLEQRRRLYAPLKLKSGIHQGINQLTTADAVYIRDINQINLLTGSQIKKLAAILHVAYGSYDLSLRMLRLLGTDFNDKDYSKRIGNPLPISVVSEPSLINPKSLDTRIASKNVLLPSKGANVTERDDLVSLECKSGKNENKIIHICFNNPHVRPLVNLLQDSYVQAGFDHVVYIEKRRSVNGYDVDITGLSNVFYFSYTEDIAALILSINSEDVIAVIFHGIFFDWQRQLLPRVVSGKSVVWSIWGGDLYNPIRAGAPVKEIQDNVNSIASYFNLELDLAESVYGKKHRLSFLYGFEFEKQAASKAKENIIFIGNAGDQGNNHLSIIKNIAQKEDKDIYFFYIPMAYHATEEYMQTVAEAAEKAGLKFEIQDKLIDKREYLAKMQKAKLLVMAQDRQQGVGNITSALYLRTHVCIKKRITIFGSTVNPLWDTLNDQFKIRLQSYEDFIEAKSITSVLAALNKHSDANREKLLAAFGQETVKSTMRKTFLRFSSDL